ncbi:hypothetical protein GRAN_5035 [Granulicella sibirica]|uniref:Uncharacterized protein n=1 Tax=Granulicella sibirica TaxID=2479048 RepID=A0A4Q0SYG8_9BACT|nr:hypothetical protein GRAN_5035 [Granulicella sibirica]
MEKPNVGFYKGKCSAHDHAVIGSNSMLSGRVAAELPQFGQILRVEINRISGRLQ